MTALEVCDLICHEDKTIGWQTKLKLLLYVSTYLSEPISDTSG